MPLMTYKEWEGLDRTLGYSHKRRMFIEVGCLSILTNEGRLLSLLA